MAVNGKAVDIGIAYIHAAHAASTRQVNRANIELVVNASHPYSVLRGRLVLARAQRRWQMVAWRKLTEHSPARLGVRLRSSKYVLTVYTK